MANVLFIAQNDRSAKIKSSYVIFGKIVDIKVLISKHKSFFTIRHDKIAHLSRK